MIMPTATNSAYWKKREEEERKWQEKNIATDAAFNRLIERYYNVAILQINKDIDHQYQSLAKSVDGLRSAYSIVDATDITDYEVEAQKLVMQAAQMRAQGKKVTYSSFTNDVNRRMKIYNATMRINRLEYLKSQVGLHLTEANMNIENDTRIKLTDGYINEVKRQAGILGRNLKYNTALIDDNNVAKIVMAQTAGANWSQRLWLNQDALKAQLDVILSTGLITGQSNQAMARQLRDQVRTTVKNHAYIAERLARTETARVQYQAQIDSIKAADYKYVKWYAEPGACRICQEINDNDEYDLGYGVFPVDEAPQIPIHPNCRCSISAYWVEGKDNLRNSNKPKKKENNEGKKTNGKTEEFDVGSIKNVRAFNKALRDNLEIKEVKNMSGVDPKYLKHIYSGISNNIKAHPELIGYIDRVSGMNKATSNVMASAGYHFEQLPNGHYKREVVLKINKAMFSLYDDMDKAVSDMVTSNWQTKKSSYEGVINHEMGHMVAQRGLDQLLGINPKTEYTYDQVKTFISAYKTRAFETPIINQTFEEAGIDLTPANLKKYISKYGATNNAEAFAELYSNENANDKMKKLFDKNLKLMTSTIYGKQ